MIVGNGGCVGAEPSAIHAVYIKKERSGGDIVAYEMMIESDPIMICF